MGPDSTLPIAELVNVGGPLGGIALVYFCILAASKLIKEIRSDYAKDAISRAEGAESERNQLLLETKDEIESLKKEIDQLRTELKSQRESHDKQLRDQDAEYRHRLGQIQTEFNRTLDDLHKKNEYLQLVNYRQREFMATKGIDPDAIPLTDVPHSDGTAPAT